MYRFLLVISLAIVLLNIGVSGHREKFRRTAEDDNTSLVYYCPPGQVLFFSDGSYWCVAKCAECPHGFCYENECHCFPGTRRDAVGICEKICKGCENGWCSSVSKCECSEGFTLSQGRCESHYQSWEQHNTWNGLSPQAALKLSSQLAVQLEPHRSVPQHRPYHGYRSHNWNDKSLWHYRNSAPPDTRYPSYQDPSYSQSPAPLSPQIPPQTYPMNGLELPQIFHSSLKPQIQLQPPVQYPLRDPSSVRPQPNSERPVQWNQETPSQSSPQYPSQDRSSSRPQPNPQRPLQGYPETSLPPSAQYAPVQYPLRDPSSVRPQSNSERPVQWNQETPSQPSPQYPSQDRSSSRPQPNPQRPLQGYPETSLQPSPQYSPQDPSSAHHQQIPERPSQPVRETTFQSPSHFLPQIPLRFNPGPNADHSHEVDTELSSPEHRSCQTDYVWDPETKACIPYESAKAPEMHVKMDD